MVRNICGFTFLVVLAVGVAVLVYLLVRKSLRALLDELVALPSCTTFYARVLLLGLLFIALSMTIGTYYDFKTDAPFMEYVWKVADAFSPVLGITCLFMTGYLIVITILVAALRQRHE
jgi:predicted tellurium resistance membrane protein TerC